MEKRNLVSIIVISYNNLQYFKGCLDSIFIQDYSDIEIIFSDDCSDDFNEDEIKEYIEEKKGDNIKKYIVNKNEINEGIVKNLNRAINLTSGDYIVHIACDDEFNDSTVISSIADFHANNNLLLAVGFIQYYKEDLKTCFAYTPSEQNIPYVIGEATACYKRLCEIGSFFPSPGLSYKKELISKYGLYNEDYKMVDDFARFLYLSRCNCRIGFINKVLIKYRAVGVTSSEKGSSVVKKIIEKDMELIKKQEIEPYYKTIAPSSNVYAKVVNNISIGNNVIFEQHIVINGEGKVTIGDNCLLGYKIEPNYIGNKMIIQAINEDSKIEIGREVNFGNEINLKAVKSISIGDKCVIGDGVTIYDCDFYEVNPKTRTNSIGKVSEVCIGNNVFIGSGVIILKGVTIGDNCVIGAGSVVASSIESNSVACGNPAKIINKINNN